MVSVTTRRNLVGNMLFAEETVKQEKKNKGYSVLTKINVTVWVM